MFICFLRGGKLPITPSNWFTDYTCIMPNLIFWIYIAVSVANVIAKVIPSEELDQFTKPLLMPLLMFYVYRSSIGKTTLRILLLSGALLFSWLGDVVLMYQADERFFMAGIGLFLIAQVIYVVVLRRSSYQKPVFNLIQMLPFLVYGGLLFYLLLPAGDFTIPIVIYGAVIMTMVIMARLREGNTSQESYRLALYGSLLFVLSDSILSINAFHTSIPYAGVFIMATYCAAQLLLVKGLLGHAE
ncbi:lysoplasmalogenase [Ekhidna sp. MALMAid0563]|uniref:lysoplasmalogenase n=1 Tax=Ekhidna sp. MALMAid0563 TaxID=3143937 RepID=UPI0032DFAB31